MRITFSWPNKQALKNASVQEHNSNMLSKSIRQSYIYRGLELALNWTVQLSTRIKKVHIITQMQL